MAMNISPSDRTPTRARTGWKKYPVTLALGILLLTQVPTEARDDQKGAAWFADPIVGTWDVVVDIVNCDTGAVIVPGSRALGLFNADGTRHETAASNPALRTPAYGHWDHVGKDAYQFDFKFFRFDATGAPIGWTIVRHDLLLTDENSYYSEGPAEFFNPNGDLLFAACAVANATRFE